MRAISLAIAALVALVGSADAKTKRIPRDYRMLCWSLFTSTHYCRTDFHYSCKKGKVIPFQEPEKLGGKAWHRPSPEGLEFTELNLAKCVAQEVKGKGYIRLLSRTPGGLHIESGCEANFRDDAFVH